jgi:hypothetical protein
MHPTTGKPESTPHDAEVLLRLVDLELEQKRQQRKRAAARHRTTRTLSIFFLIMLIAGVFFAFFFLSSEVRQRPQTNRPNPSHQPTR